MRNRLIWLQGGLEQRLRSAVTAGDSPQHCLPRSSAAVADFSDTVQQLIYDLLMLKVLKLPNTLKLFWGNCAVTRMNFTGRPLGSGFKVVPWFNVLACILY